MFIVHPLQQSAFSTNRFKPYHQQLFSYFPVQSDQSADFFSCQFLQTSSSFRFLQLSPQYFHFSLLIVCEQYSHWSLRISVECFHSDHRSVSLTKLLVSHFLVSSFMSVRFLSSHVKFLQAVKLTWWLCCEGFQEQISLPVMLKFREMCWFLMTRQYGRESVHNRSSDRQT